MRYVSTRGGCPAVGFTETLLEGLAPDGGLYIPESWPAFTHDEIAAFAGMPYAHVAAEVLSRFIGGDINRRDLDRICAEAYATFAHPAVTPLEQLDSDLCSMGRRWRSRTWRCNCSRGCTISLWAAEVGH